MVKTEAWTAARALAGHDRGRLFFIIRTEQEYVWLADGVRRTLARPKRKKRKHVQVIRRIPKAAEEILESAQTLSDEHIIQAIQVIQAESQGWQEEKHVESRCN
ncbi:MAG: KOW domain-containing RNA-binding protein [Eubacteriales bacterium]|nr:KOW domain-containing RNA-binding protein [Eubacteriales bacterium]